MSAPRAAGAQTSDATLTVTLRAAGEGQCNNLGRVATRVWVLARSGVAPRWNGPTSIAFPLFRSGPTTSAPPPQYSQRRQGQQPVDPASAVSV